MEPDWSGGIKEPRIYIVGSEKPLEDSESAMGTWREPQGMTLHGKATPGSRGLPSIGEALRELKLDPLHQHSSQSATPRTLGLFLRISEVKYQPHNNTETSPIFITS